MSLPGLGADSTLYAFQLDDKSNPATPAEVAIFGSSAMSVNTGVGFYGVLDYLYDPVAGYVGYRWNGAGQRGQCHSDAGPAGCDQLRQWLPH